ncbi:MAG: DUF2304 domain-containing protein [Candidatus Riflebacteria bacterium]|nr:DUF2304 domain-containing protein [Candidatus Riflebacteria bacterium]
MPENDLPPKQRILSVFLSFVIFFLTIDLVRRKEVREEESWIWLLVGFIIFVLGTSFGILSRITSFFGIIAPISTLFFFGQMFFIIFGMHISASLSKTKGQIKNIGQEIALLNLKLDEIKKNYKL